MPCAPAPTSSSRARPAPASRRPSSTSSPRSRPRASRTLFVAEKRAAIDAVLSRLDRLGLGDLVLDAYDGTTNKRATAQQFARSLDAAVRERQRPRPTARTSTLRDRRARLQKHVDALHAVRDPWGVSAHDAQEALVELGTRTPPPTLPRPPRQP